MRWAIVVALIVAWWSAGCDVVVVQTVQPVPSPTVAGISPAATSTTEVLYTQTATPEPTKQQFCVHTGFTGGYLNVRSGPGVEYRVVGMLREGERVAIVVERALDGWYPLSNGGWVRAKFVHPCQE